MSELVLLIAGLAILKRINAEPTDKRSLVLWLIVGLALFGAAVVLALLDAIAS